MSAETSEDEPDVLARIARTHPQHVPLAHEAAAEIRRLQEGARKLVEEWRQPESCADDPWNSAKEWCADELEELVNG